MNDIFRKFAAKVSQVVGSSYAFVFALIIISIWALTGSFFNFSDTWQLVINTGTTIATFLIVFLIQNTQNRDSKALHMKLDELIKSSKSARDSFVNLEEMSDEDIEKLHSEFQKLHDKYQEELKRRKGI